MLGAVEAPEDEAFVRWTAARGDATATDVGDRGRCGGCVLHGARWLRSWIARNGAEKARVLATSAKGQDAMYQRFSVRVLGAGLAGGRSIRLAVIVLSGMAGE
jgi:hypothetical protein